MTDLPRNYRQHLQHQAESVVVLPVHRQRPDYARPLGDTTLLILGPARGNAPPYRLWACELGGIGLHIDGEFGLIDWLERNTFVKAVVVVDDDRLDPQDAANIAAHVRQLRPDVPVILAVDHDNDEFEADSGWPSFAVEHRPIALSTFVKAIEIARLMATFDRENQPRRTPNLAAQVGAYPEGHEALDDHMSPYSGWWIIPVIVAGLLFWALIVWLLVPGLFSASPT